MINSPHQFESHPTETWGQEALWGQVLLCCYGVIVMGSCYCYCYCYGVRSCIHTWRGRHEATHLRDANLVLMFDYKT